MAIAVHPEGCRGCPLDEIGTGFTQIEGTGSLGVMVIAEASGEAEARDSLPLRPFAQSGSVFEKACQRASINRQQLAVTNVIRCRPPNNKLEGTEYEAEAINHCSQYLDAAVKKFKPRAILALGGVATRTLTGLTGPKLGVSNIRGMILHSNKYDLPVVASLHPSYIRRMGMRLTEVLTYDLSLAKQVAEGKRALEPIEKVKYVTDPDTTFLEMSLEAWGKHPDWAIGFDIETAYSIKEMDESGIELASDAITQIQFSIAPHWAVVLPWNKETKEFATKVLALPNDKYSWNGVLFDQRVLAKNGIHIAGRHIDGMDVWHVLQPDLPRGLQFVTSFYAPELGPWKHLSGSQMDFYGGRDVDSLMRIVPRMLADLEKRGVSRGYWEHCQRLRPILDRMCERGLPIDVEGQNQLRFQLEGEMRDLFAEIQTVVPRELLKYKKTSGGRDYYKGVPPEFKKIEGTNCQPEDFGYFKVEREGELHWAKLEGFNPNSSDQMKEYARLKGYKIPLAERANGEESETANDKTVLEWALKHDDPMCKKVVEYKKRQKIISTYIDGFRPGEDGRVHSEFGFGPATGQLASHNPSILNYPKHGELAKAVRNLIKAADGKILIEFDMKAFHAKTLGWLARSPAYMRLSDLDIHSYVAAHFIKGQIELGKKGLGKALGEYELMEWCQDTEGLENWLSLPDEELSVKLANIKRKYKSIRDEKAKRAILGIGFGMGASKLYKMNKEAFGSTAEANSIILLVRRLFPEVFEWQEATKDRAHRQSFLLSMHGSIRRFFEVKRWDPQDRRWKGGENAEECLAFLPASSAFGEIKDRIIEMEELGLLERYGLINHIHDSVVFECPLELVDECIPTIKAILERPSTILVDSVMGAFQCSADVQMGVRWGELKEIKVG